jgi:hypothetical protein
MIFCRFGSILISKSNSNFCLNRKPTRGRFLLVRTSLNGSVMWSVGSKWTWTDQICSYLFGLVIYSGTLDRDPTAVIEAERCSPGWSRFSSSPARCGTGMDDGDLFRWSSRSKKKQTMIHVKRRRRWRGGGVRSFLERWGGVTGD